MINPKLPLLIRHDTNVEEHTTERHVASIHDDLPSRWFVPFMHWKNKPRNRVFGLIMKKRSVFSKKLLSGAAG